LIVELSSSFPKCLLVVSPLSSKCPTIPQAGQAGADYEHRNCKYPLSHGVTLPFRCDERIGRTAILVPGGKVDSGEDGCPDRRPKDPQPQCGD